MIRVALYEPEIPPNTGNIGRLCVGFGIPLILVEPLGFSIDDRTLKRAGLDYWGKLDLTRVPNMEQLMTHLASVGSNSDSETSSAPSRMICLSKFGKDSLYDWSFEAGDVLLMGSETRGVPSEVTERYDITRVHLPMSNNIRSYNLANATAMSIAEAYRQLRWSLK